MRGLFSLAVLFVVSLVTQAQTIVSHVYIQTPQGVDLYTLNSANKLTLATGSPFKTVGLGAGTNGKYWISVGTNILHVYAINQTTGAIGAQVSQIDTSLYAGADCGTTGPTTLDHTGQFFYVQHWNTPQPDSGMWMCNAFQTFKVNSSNGQMTFMGNNETTDGTHMLPADMFSIVAAGNFAFGELDEGWGSYSVAGYSRSLSTGDLTGPYQSTSYPPTANPSSYYFFPTNLTPDPSNHIAMAVATSGTDGPYPTLYGPGQLASYTISASSGLTSTNTYSNMPALTVNADVMNMSPSGKILAVGGGTNPNQVPLRFIFGSSGLQLFHFNGASPITPFSSVLTKTPIDYIHWDNANHLYALSASTGKLYVYTVTTTTITPVPGSPFTIKSIPSAGLYATALAVR
jgi:hypothetical protein